MAQVAGPRAADDSGPAANEPAAAPGDGGAGHAGPWKRPKFESLYAAAMAKLDAAPRDPFATGSPKIESLGQGRLGDCFLLASLGAVAHRDPDRLKRMMRPTSDGKVAVTFGDGKMVVLPPPTDAEIVIGA